MKGGPDTRKGRVCPNWVRKTTISLKKYKLATWVALDPHVRRKVPSYFFISLAT